MEKRLFLAIILSVAILYVWSAMNPRQQVIQPQTNVSQVVGVQEDIALAPSPFVNSQEPVKVQSSIAPVVEKIYILEASKLLVEFSNIGGKPTKVLIKDYDTTLPIKDINGLSGYENVEFAVRASSGNKIEYEYKDDLIEVIKSYEIFEDEYTVRANVTIEKLSDMSNLNDIAINAFSLDMSNLTSKKQDISSSRDKSLFEYIVTTDQGIFRKAKAFKFSEKDNKQEQVQVNWFGFRNRYFCALFHPEYVSSGYTIESKGDKTLQLSLSSTGDNRQRVELASTIYIGPEKLDILKEYGLGFEKIRRYYKLGLFDSIAKVINTVIALLHKIVPNWGICIILVSFIIYFSMYPLTIRSLSSMKKMQALQPKINALKEKHKNSPQKMNKETMELYKEYKINPLGGCLPMLLQMPVFIGLYQVLWRSVSFKGAHFLWIKDLSQPDRLFILPYSLPIIGNEINILPLLMMVVMFFQQKFSTKNMATTDPSQAAQQKMMATIFPIFLGFIFYKFASGLALYFTMFYLLSTYTQWKMSKDTKVIA
ncbi:MAG: YidC/Oxa1 family insertase periplasmic-domain containing protein [Candidatus Zapsychrus exili]|nr:YidC/Oxa1 family insertase periplasmic-domain containing protein [Candidatus Zapsychrus exili]